MNHLLKLHILTLLLFSVSAATASTRFAPSMALCDRHQADPMLNLREQLNEIEEALETDDSGDEELWEIDGQGLPSLKGCSGSERGVASVYGIPGRDRFAGKKTASGDVMRPGKMRAAMLKSAGVEYPLGTWVKVTKDGQSVFVCLNDTGGGKRGRIIDLTSAAAGAIDNGDLGQVEVECVAKPTTRRQKCDDASFEAFLERNQS